MPGGTAHCNVVVSSQEIGTPLVDQPDVLIAMNGPSLSRFEAQVKPGGLILFDSSLISWTPERPDVDQLGIPASQMAHELGELKVANLIVLGALMGRIPFLETATIHKAIDTVISNPNLRNLNTKALELGRQVQAE